MLAWCCRWQLGPALKGCQRVLVCSTSLPACCRRCCTYVAQRLSNATCSRRAAGNDKTPAAQQQSAAHDAHCHQRTAPMRAPSVPREQLQHLSAICAHCVGTSDSTQQLDLWVWHWRHVAAAAPVLLAVSLLGNTLSSWAVSVFWARVRLALMGPDSLHFMVWAQQLPPLAISKWLHTPLCRDLPRPCRAPHVCLTDAPAGGHTTQHRVDPCSVCCRPLRRPLHQQAAAACSPAPSAGSGLWCQLVTVYFANRLSGLVIALN